MSNIVIKVEGLGKQYHIGVKKKNKETIIDLLSDVIKMPFNQAAKLIRGEAYGAIGLEEKFWSLRDISFEVKESEILGVIGPNGAGKSTLLKILSRITEPTEGYAEIHGRVGSLLEVATGFNPLFTGRENVYMNGTLLGMKKQEIAMKFDEIVSFSGVEKFIDTPIKYYSSGMSVRLAFAVAAHLDPEILLIDEVLTVGDAEFQRKCLGKMEDVAKGGRTIIFISHNMAAVNNLCTRAILLNEGKIKFSGDTNNVVNEYLNNVFDNNNKAHVSFEDDAKKPIQILNITLVGDNASPVSIVEHNENVVIEIQFIIRKSNKDYYAFLSLVNSQGICVFNSTDEDVEKSMRLGLLEPGRYTYSVPIPAKLLSIGKYSITVNFNQKRYGGIDCHANIISFEVIDTLSYRALHSGYRSSAVAPEITWLLI